MLSGIIPREIVRLKLLESLDLSTNRLSDEGLVDFHSNTICPGDDKEPDGGTENSNPEDEKRYRAPGFYINIGDGFTLGFREACGL
ncbi:hypothetical protein QQP08_003129 [Theobroma cacao]|nr:hypothetical protein QQP08_003129 [Theobroma cacao]